MKKFNIMAVLLLFSISVLAIVFLCFLKIWTAKKPAPPQRVYQELSEKL